MQLFLMKRDVTSVVLFSAILHRLCMAVNGDSYGFLTSRAATIYRMCKIQHSRRKVEYLTRFFRKERSRSVGARARTRQILITIFSLRIALTSHNGDERRVKKQSKCCCSASNSGIGRERYSWGSTERSFRRSYRSRAEVVASVSGN